MNSWPKFSSFEEVEGRRGGDKLLPNCFSCSQEQGSRKIGPYIAGPLLAVSQHPSIGDAEIPALSRVARLRFPRSHVASKCHREAHEEIEDSALKTELEPWAVNKAEGHTLTKENVKYQTAAH